MPTDGCVLLGGVARSKTGRGNKPVVGAAAGVVKALRRRFFPPLWGSRRMVRARAIF